MKEGLWYLRVFKTGQHKDGEIQYFSQYNELILPAFDVVRVIRHQVKIDAVELETGRVVRHDYKKPLPQWLQDPLIRQMVASTGKLP
jgi:hypothetical protein